MLRFATSRFGRRLALVVAAGAALAVPPVATTHGSIEPSPAPIGAGRFVVAVPNDSINVPITGFRLVAPDGVSIEEAESNGGFDAAVTPTGAEWTGGSVSGQRTARFFFRATLPATALVVFQGEEIYGTAASGPFESGLFPLPVPVSANATPLADRGGGGATLIIVAAIALAAIALGLAVGLRWRARRSGVEHRPS